MPRAPSEKQSKAEKLFYKGMKLTDIAKKLGVPEGTVRSWKNRGKWGDNSSKKNNCNVANNDDKNATLQKKRGAPKGNKNALGNRGNPNPEIHSALKHGGYSQVYWDTLDEEEKELIEDMSDDIEMQLLDTIRLYTVRERRLMKAINMYKHKDEDGEKSKGEKGFYISMTSTMRTKRDFKNKEEEAEYNRIVAEKVSRGDRMPGEQYEITTMVNASIDLIARLEKELSTVQSKKNQAIDSLSKYRFEQQKISGGSSNDLVEAWANKVMKKRKEITQDE